MKTIKRLLLRPFYAFYWIKFKIQEFFNLESRFEVCVHRDTLSDRLEKIGLRDFNSWLLKHGYWRLSTQLDNLKVIVPHDYVEFFKKFTNFKPYYPELRALHALPENNVFYHYEDGEVKASDKPGEPVTIALQSAAGPVAPPDPIDW